MNQMYAQVVNGTITKLNKRRGTIRGLGKLSPDSTYISKGYYPITGDKPTVSLETQRVQGPQYVLEGQEVKRVYEIIDISQDEIEAKYLVSCEKAVDSHILSQFTSLGYDGIDSIAKYMRTDSPWYAECMALGSWVDSCWLKCHELLAIGTILSTDELLAAMPVYGEEE